MPRVGGSIGGLNTCCGLGGRCWLLGALRAAAVQAHASAPAPLLPLLPAGKGVQHPGGFLGVAERVAHIKAVGANALILTPSYATAQGAPGIEGAMACCMALRALCGAARLARRRRTAAGAAVLAAARPRLPPPRPALHAGIGVLSRAAVHYLAADPTLASSGDRNSSLAAAAEFRQMLAQLHEAGIEVLLQASGLGRSARLRLSSHCARQAPQLAQPLLGSCQPAHHAHRALLACRSHCAG